MGLGGVPGRARRWARPLWACLGEGGLPGAPPASVIKGEEPGLGRARGLWAEGSLCGAETYLSPQPSGEPSGHPAWAPGGHTCEAGPNQQQLQAPPGQSFNQKLPQSARSKRLNHRSAQGPVAVSFTDDSRIRAAAAPRPLNTDLPPGEEQPTEQAGA